MLDQGDPNPGPHTHVARGRILIIKHFFRLKATSAIKIIQKIEK